MLECFRSGWHEESGVSTDLPQLRVSETILDDAIDEAQGDWVVLHLGAIQFVEEECRTLLDDDGVIPSVKWSSGLESDLAFKI